MQRAWRCSVVGAVLLLLLGGLVAAQGIKQLTVAQVSDAKTLDPTAVSGVETANVNIHIFDGLVRTTPDMQLQPALATSWEVVDPTTWKVYLRQGVKFHNGQAFTAQDVEFTIERILDPTVKSGLRSYISVIKDVEVLDDYTILIHLSNPYALLMRQIARAVLVVPKALFQEYGAEKFATNPVGTGPYKFVEWVKDQRVVLEANDQYWAGRPRLDKLVFRPISEPSTRVSALLAGEVDIVAGVRPDQIATIEKDPKFSVVGGGGLTQDFVIMNSFHEPLNDVRVRQAILYAMDPQEIADTLFMGHAQVIPCAVCTRSFGYDPSLKPYGHDPERAKALLAEAGYPNGIGPLEFWYDASGGASGLEALASQIMAEQLASVGIKTTLRPVESTEFNLQMVNKGTCPGLAYSNCRDAIGDADYCIGLWYDTKRRSFYFNTPELDAMIAQAGSMADESARLEKLHEIQKYIYDNAGAAFLYQEEMLFGVSKRVTGFEPRGDRVIYISPSVDVSGS